MIRALLAIGILFLSLTSTARAQSNTHGLPNTQREMQAWFGDKTLGDGHIVSGCEPAVPSSSLTLGAFACEAYVGGSGSEQWYVNQSAKAVGPLSGGNGTYWLGVHRDSTTAIGSCTRQAQTHYFWCKSTTIPTATGGFIFNKVTVGGGVVTATAVVGSYDVRNENVVNVEQFGARTTETAANNAAAIQRALDHAAAVNGRVVFPKVYPITRVRVANGVREIQGPGGLQGTGQFGTFGALVELEGSQFSGTTTVDTLRIHSLQFVMSTSGTGAKYGIYGDCSSCVIANNIFTSFEDINGHSGITLFNGTNYTRILGNQIFMVQPPLTGSNTATGIGLRGTVADYGGYFSGSGTCSAASTPATHNVIVGNMIFGGSHGMLTRGTTHTTITGNNFHFQHARGIEMEYSSNINTISGNVFSEFYSSAVNLSYCSSYNTVSGNTAYSTVTNGQAPFLAYVGTTDNLFANNKILTSGTATLYGIYFAINASRNVAEGNDISGIRIAGIAIDSDWKDPQPATAYYSLAISAASSPSGQWAYGNSDANVIQNNIIRSPTGSAAAGISVAAIGTAGGVSDTIVKGNHVQSTSFDHQWYVYEENVSDPASGIWLMHNSWNTGFFYMGPRGNGHYKMIEGNYALNGPGAYAFADGDATPDVTIGNQFQTANTAPTTITMFDGTQYDGREITVRLDSNTSITHDNTKIRLRGGSNITGVDANFFIHFRNLSGIWYELWRQGA